MNLSTLKTARGSRKNRKRVGRGHATGNGKTAGRGHKGQKSRAGHKRRYGFEGGQMPLHRRLPKRGFYHQKRHPLGALNVDVLNERFEDGAVVTAETLYAAHLVHETSGGVKVLGRGELTKKLTVRVQAISPSAQSKIEAAGGTVEIIAPAGMTIDADAVEAAVVAEAPAAKAPAVEAAPADAEAPADEAATEEEE